MKRDYASEVLRRRLFKSINILLTQSNAMVYKFPVYYWEFALNISTK
jgi:hypothetical protein